jgi:HAD superfamily hydrolase (TIGR01509 family)
MLRAVIFDFNGVLVDDEPLHCRLFQKVLSEKKIPLSDKDYYEKYLGFDDRDAFAAVLRDRGVSFTPQDIQELIEKKAALYQKEILKKDLFLPGAAEFVKQASEKYFLGLVSGALRSEIEGWLDRGRIRSLFQAIVAAEDVQKGKPDPEGYFRALSLINRDAVATSEMILPQECLVIEDSVWGIESAHAAAMKCLALAISYPKEKLKAAEWVAGSYSEITLARLAENFNSASV